MEFIVQPSRWGFCLFSLNVPIGVLKHFPDLRPKSTGNLFDSMRKAVTEENHVCDACLFGIHDYIYLFQASTVIADEAARHSVIQELAEWAQAVALLKEPEQRARLYESAEVARSTYLNEADLTGEQRIWIDEQLPRLSDGRTLKVPTLYNYTHDVLIPLFPADLHGQLRDRGPRLGNRVSGFCFLRVDPRIARLCASADSSNAGTAYSLIQAALARVCESESSVEGVWAGIGISNLVVLLSSVSFRRLMDTVSALRDSVRVPVQDREYPFSLIATSSTLIVPPRCEEAVPDLTAGVRFYILVRVLSGFHSERAHTAIREICTLVGLEGVSVGKRQGLFDIVINLHPDSAFLSISRLVLILDAFCPFVEDVATIICTAYDDEHVEGAIRTQLVGATP